MTTVRAMAAADVPQVAHFVDEASPAWRTPRLATELTPIGSYVVRSRFHKEPDGCFVAEVPGHGLGGAVFSITWGSVGWLGPLAMHPECREKGVEQELIRAVLDHWEPLTLSAQGVETVPDSPSHLERYAAYGFRPQFLTATLVGAVDPERPRPPIAPRSPRFELVGLSQLTDAMEDTMLQNCRRISERHYPGLDYGKELQSMKDLNLGDTLLLAVGERLYGFAMCHATEASEAAAAECYVKALLIDPAIDDPETLLALVEACESYARLQKRVNVRLSVNLACWEGYHALAARGYQIKRLRVRMVRPREDILSDSLPFHFNDWQ